jgi:hypothetical protein
MRKKDTKFGADVMGALKEVRAHRLEDTDLPSRVVDTTSPKAAPLACG